ncbi:MAG: hypothetical protein WC981_02675 [Candidatus Dojkabacteria bacterium]
MKENKVKKTLALVLEPIALGLLALLFIIPAITVVNLQPITKKIKDLNVLGVTNSSGLKVNIIGGSHLIFLNERIDSNEDIYTYKTKLVKREADSYSKPILEIVNDKDEDVNLEIYGGTSIPTNSDIGIIIEEQRYRLQEPNGNLLTQKITLRPKETYVIYLYIESFSDVRFEEDFELNIKEVQ